MHVFAMAKHDSPT